MTETTTPKNPAALPVELSGHAYIWARAVALQAERVRTAKSIEGRHVDGFLLILALRQVLRSAEAMDDAVGGDEELRQAQARFMNDHPQAQNMRDVLSHFDEYEAGIGKLQKAGEVGALAIWLGTGGDSTTVALASNLTIELLGASSDALDLANATLSARDRYLACSRKTRSEGTESA